MTTKISGTNTADFVWYCKAIGEVFYLRDDLAGVTAPPTDDPNFRYIKLTHNDAYNTGAVTTPTSTGTAPYITSTAVISLAGSPLNGLTVNMINTERRFLRAGSSGALEDDSYKSHNHGVNDPGHVHAHPLWGTVGGGGSYYSGNASTPQNASNTQASGTGISIQNNGASETKPRNQGVTAYMRIK